MKKKILILLAIFLITNPLAARTIKFLKKDFRNTILMIDSRPVRFNPGETKKGITLMSSTKSNATIKMNGKEYIVDKKGPTRKKTNFTVLKRYGGMFYSKGKINDKDVDFVVDTGATFVSISKKTARKIKLRYSKNDPIKIQTASKTETAYLTTLKSVELGDITLTNIQAIVSQHNYPAQVLLGNSFLQHLKVQQTGDLLYLKK